MAAHQDPLYKRAPHQGPRDQGARQAPWKEELPPAEQEEPEFSAPHQPPLTTNIRSLQLREKLETLHCHFTWNFEDHGKLEIRRLLQTLAIRIKCTPYANQAAFYTLQAYLCEREGRYRDALRSLQKAEEVLKDSHPSNFNRSVLVTYGNYAWIYYYMSDYDRVEQYLDKIKDIYKSLNHPTQPAFLIHEINAVKGWSLLATGYKNGEVAAGCFKEALAEDPSNKDLHAGLAIALYAITTCFGASKELTAGAKTKLQEVICEDPLNHEVRVCLMLLFWDSDKTEPLKLAEGATQNSCYAKFFSETTCLYTVLNFKRDLQILRKIISLHEHYYLLYKDLGSNFQKQLEKDIFCWNPNIFSTVIQELTKHIELVPSNTFAKICLAELYGMNKQVGLQKEIYTLLKGDFPNLSRKEQQAFYLSYGKFQVYQMDLLEDGAKLFVNGFNISSSTSEGQQCRKHLWKIMQWFERDGRTWQAAEISKHIQT